MCIHCGLFCDDPIPDFFKIHKEDEFGSKWFPDHCAHFYTKQYDVRSLTESKFTKFNNVLAEMLAKKNEGTLQSVKICELDDGFNCFEAEYVEHKEK